MRHAAWLCCLLLVGTTHAADPPPDLERWLTGDPQDAKVEPQGPALILMGGGKDVDAAFRWWRPKLNGGDVVVLRASGADGYNRYLHAEIGGCDSVETLKVTTRRQADSDWVAERVAQAEGIWIAGGDQWRYVERWRGTKLLAAVQAALERGAVVGGTSAGCAVLGGVVFSAEHGTVKSADALADPFTRRVTLEPALVRFAPLAGVLADTHFGARDRLGRLAAFLAHTRSPAWTRPQSAPGVDPRRPEIDDPARAPATLGLGIGERTAVVITADGQAQVLGKGQVMLVRITAGGAQPGQALDVELEAVPLLPRDRFRLPSGDGHPRTIRRLRARAGELGPLR